MRITWELLREMLHLPEDTKLVRAALVHQFETDEVSFTIEQPDLPAVNPDAPVPDVIVRYEVQPVPIDQVLTGTRVMFKGWEVDAKLFVPASNVRRDSKREGVLPGASVEGSCTVG